MGHSMMHHSSQGNGEDWTRIFFIPLPMAMFGVLVSFMFGATIGSMMARKHAMMGPGMMGWKHRMGMHKGMRHHHHGDGPACRCSDWPEQLEEHAIDPME